MLNNGGEYSRISQRDITDGISSDVDSTFSRQRGSHEDSAPIIPLEYVDHDAEDRIPSYESVDKEGGSSPSSYSFDRSERKSCLALSASCVQLMVELANNYGWIMLRFTVGFIICIAAITNLWNSESGLFGTPNCKKSMRDGHWSGKPGIQDLSARWITNTCMMAPYTDKELKKCFKGAQDTRIVLIGDSTMREIYGRFRQRLIPHHVLSGDDQPHENHNVTDGGVMIQFFFNHYLIRQDMMPILQDPTQANVTLLMLSGGPWYVKDFEYPEGMNQFAGVVKEWVDEIRLRHHEGRPLAKWTVIRYLSPLVDSLLHEARRKTMWNDKIISFNEALQPILGIFDAADSSSPILSNRASGAMIASALDKSLDGLHFATPVAESEVDIMLQQLCNRVLYHGPFNDVTTCCVPYPAPKWF
ncbi:hypothetical protein HDU76_001822 [Blyttiomyces sp. JEL0837]|nr:hypothetical protein HDU76_001822 [Blyttiomyces sp. JEL0837]